MGKKYTYIYNLTCVECGNEFESHSRAKKYCGECKENKHECNNQASVCIDCTRYFECEKFKEPLTVQPFMTDYIIKVPNISEFGRKTENDLTLKVNKCDNFKSGAEETLQERLERRQRWINNADKLFERWDMSDKTIV